MKKKLIILLLSLFFIGAESFCQSKIHGMVSIFNSETNTGKRQYVNNAEVIDDFGKAQRVATYNNGEFELIFNKVEDNESVSFQVKKKGLQVVNLDALTAITGQREMVKISMAVPDSITEYRKRIYFIGKTAAEIKLEKLVATKTIDISFYKKNAIQNEVKIKQLEAEILKVKEQLKIVDQQAQELAKQYTIINLDDASPLFRKAFDLFKLGMLDSALIILKNADLLNGAENILLERKSIFNEKITLKRRDSVQQQRTDVVSKALQFKADLHKTLFEFDSAVVCYEAIMKLNPFDAEYTFNYARFLEWLRENDKAIFYYSKIISSFGNKITPLLAEAYNNLGNVYQEKNDYLNSEKFYFEAIKIKSFFSTFNTWDDEAKADLASTENNLANLYNINKQYGKADTVYKKSLEIYKNLAKYQPQVYELELANTLNNLGNFYLSINKVNEADSVIIQSLNIYKRRNSYNRSYQFEIARVYLNLGNLYWITQKFDSSEEILLESVKIFDSCASKNPKTYNLYVVEALNDLGITLISNKKFEKAKIAFYRALEVITKLSKEDITVNGKKLLNVQNGLKQLVDVLIDTAIKLQDTKNYKSAENFLENGLEIEYKVNLNTEDSVIASITNFLGIVYASDKKFNRADSLFLSSYLMYERLNSKSPKAYEAWLTYVAKNTLTFYSDVLDSLKYNSFKFQIIDHFKIMESVLYNQSKVDTTFARYLENFYGKCSYYLLYVKKFKEAEYFATKGLEIYPHNYTRIKTVLAFALLLQGQYEKALILYKELKFSKRYDGKPYTTICLEDLDNFESRGITNKDVNRIRLFLESK